MSDKEIPSYLLSISPIDGRYSRKTEELQEIFSEYGLIKRRVHVEIGWFRTLSHHLWIKELQVLSSNGEEWLNRLLTNFGPKEALRVKEIEGVINHDVKAVEYYIKEKMHLQPELSDKKEFVHFACTSEDINNVAYGLMIRDGRAVISAEMETVENMLEMMAKELSNVPMLAKTHGQPASTTTMGKELRVFEKRLEREKGRLKGLPIYGKMNGAVGNYNAHSVAYPTVDWPGLARQFVDKFGLAYNDYTTQIEPHDYMSDIFDSIRRSNVILIDMCRDIWGYISQGYFRQAVIDTEVGSSTMPHKVNPIDFENAEGNLGVANALFDHLSNSLPVSRFQRDLSDSTVLRNVGVAFAHSLIAYKSIQRGLRKLECDEAKLKDDLVDMWAVLAEPIQTVMRKHGVANPYEKLKRLTRGHTINRELIHAFIRGLDLPDDAKAELTKLTPDSYLGYARDLADG